MTLYEPSLLAELKYSFLGLMGIFYLKRELVVHGVCRFASGTDAFAFITFIANTLCLSFTLYLCIYLLPGLFGFLFITSVLLTSVDGVR